VNVQADQQFLLVLDSLWKISACFGLASFPLNHEREKRKNFDEFFTNLVASL
jgi:hypothetical protein